MLITSWGQRLCQLQCKHRASLLSWQRVAKVKPYGRPWHGSARAIGGSTVTHASSGYWTIAEDYMHQVELKKSLFITTAWPVTSAAEALAHIEGASDPTASHNCYAFKVAGSARSNDDGEPSGTAGRPILGAIEADGLDGVCVLVVRYFGGTKLGAGGLVRAYASAARDCLRAAPKVFIKAQSELSVTTTFEHLSTVYNLLARYGGKTGAEDYNDKGQVCLQIMLDADQAEPLQQALADATSGRVKARLVGS